MAWPCWPSHQSPLTAWPQGQLNFPTAEWSLWNTALINAHGCCCSRCLGAPHISKALKFLMWCKTAGEEKGKEMEEREEEKAVDWEDYRKVEDQQEGRRKKQKQKQNLKHNPCTLAVLPSNLTWVCSHFHRERKGKMREAARRKNKRDEDCYWPQWLPQSLCGSHCLPSTETMLTKSSEHNHLTVSKCAVSVEVLVWQRRADLLYWALWLSFHIICTASL